MNDLVPTNWFYIIPIGFFAGTLGSLLGVGGGILVVPALVIFLEFDQKIAQGTSLAMMVPMAMMATYKYHVNPSIVMNWKVVGWLIPFAIIGAYVGSSLVPHIPAPILKRIFGIYVIAAGIKMIWKSF